MNLKRLLGLCEYPACKHMARRSMIIKHKNGKVKELRVCEDCAWLIRMAETKIEVR